MSADGIWNCKINSPMGSQEGKMTLVTDGESLSGKMEGPQGTQEFEGGSVAGGNLSWKMEMTSPMPMTLEVSASVDGVGGSLAGYVTARLGVLHLCSRHHRFHRHFPRRRK